MSSTRLWALEVVVILCAYSAGRIHGALKHWRGFRVGYREGWRDRAYQHVPRTGVNDGNRHRRHRRGAQVANTQIFPAYTPGVAEVLEVNEK